MNQQETNIDKRVHNLSNVLGPHIIKECNDFRRKVLTDKAAEEIEVSTAVLHALASSLASVAVEVIRPTQREAWIKHIEKTLRESFR